MTRKRDGPPAPKAPRVRKKKAETEKKVEMPVYEPVIGTTGMMMEEGMYTQDYGFAYGNQPQFSNESASSPFVGNQTCSTPQPPMMMRPPIPQGVPPTSQGMPPPSQGPPQGQMGQAPTPLEFRIHDMNRRLYTFNNSGISETDHRQWFEAFAHEFFDDDAVLCITFPEDQQLHLAPEKLAIHRNLIPRFFLSFIESSVKEMYFVLRGSTRESVNSQTGLIHFENDNVLQVTRMEHPISTQVEAECKLTIEFTQYDEILNHRIRLWSMEMRTGREFFVNEITKELQPADHDKRVTRCGVTPNTMHFLHMARILEPMQLLMTHSKAHHITEPKELLRRTLFNHQQKMQEMQRMNTPMMPPTPVEEAKPKPTRKRQRKPPASKAKKANASPAPSNPSFPTNPMQGNFTAMGYQDVMVVGEPSMMGGDYGEEDERTISRVENTQYDPNALQMQQAAMSSMGQGMMPPGGLPPGGPPIGHMPPPNGVPQHGGMPTGMPPGHPSQMGQMGPPANGMPPPYAFGQPPSSWPNQPNTTMITG